MALIDEIRTACASASRELLGRCNADGFWSGQLSSSALATATAAFALARCDGSLQDRWVVPALQWLCATQNADGGWGDTPDSPSNVATSLLAWCALGLDQARSVNACEAAQARARAYLARLAGGVEPAQLAGAVLERYGKDRTFSVPILTMAALSGRLGSGSEAWRHVLPLPFELAAMSQRLWRMLRLPVVSYAAPALIAIGQARFHHAPPGFFLTRWLRRLAIQPTRRLLAEIQPSSGGFLEAAPLASFVLMSLCSMGLSRHVVAQKAAEFLRFTVRPDGSWPIDANLSVWLTTLAARALAGDLDDSHRQRLRQWLLRRQSTARQPYTRAEPGGWAWTELSGGVCDADDTAGALVALHELDPLGSESLAAARAGADWLLGLQNADGGLPTFCRGWGRLPFDRSSPDLTAHALLAWQLWRRKFSPSAGGKIESAMRLAVGFLEKSRRPNGAWSPLWFGNQWAIDQENLVYGTSRVLLALAVLAEDWPVTELIRGGMTYLLEAQNADGGWGGSPRMPDIALGATGQTDVDSSIEETAVAVEALAACLGVGLSLDEPNSIVGGDDEVLRWETAARQAVEEGSRFLLERTRHGGEFPSSPIGLYFAKLWYSERLYPILFTIAAWKRALLVLQRPQAVRGGA